MRKPYPLKIDNPFQVEILEKTRLKHANATLKGLLIHVKIPRHWPRAMKEEVAQELVDRVIQRHERDQRKMAREVSLDEELVTFDSQEALSEYVFALNAETLQSPLKGVRVGQAKFTRLAQVNLKTRMMTVSRFCLKEVPRDALRYLIIHELAHFYERGHNARFWGIVAQYVPDYKQQARRMRRYHEQAVHEELVAIPAPLAPPEGSPQPMLPSPRQRPLKPRPVPVQSLPSAPPKSEGFLQLMLDSLFSWGKR